MDIEQWIERLSNNENMDGVAGFLPLSIFEMKDEETEKLKVLLDFSHISVACHIITVVFPEARYGFDFSPLRKESKSKPAAAWVKYKHIDWTISHKDISLALILALLHVFRDWKKFNEN